MITEDLKILTINLIEKVVINLVDKITEIIEDLMIVLLEVEMMVIISIINSQEEMILPLLHISNRLLNINEEIHKINT